MAQPLPIGDILNEAFMFGVKRWGTVLRYIFAPIVVAMLIVVGFVFSVMDFNAAQALGGAASWEEIRKIFRVSPAAVIAGFMALILFVQFMMAGAMASVFRLAALGEERPGLFQIRLDGPAMRTFFANLIYSMLSFAVFAAAFLAAAAIASQNPMTAIGEVGALFVEAINAAERGGDLSPDRIGEAADAMGLFGLAMLLWIVPFIYVSVRLAPFIAGSAAENRLLLFGSFALTEGRFWSVFGVFFLLALLMMVINMVVQIVFAVIELVTEMLASVGGGAALAGLVIMLIYLVTVFIYQAFVMGVQLSAQAIVYRRLKTGA